MRLIKRVLAIVAALWILSLQLGEKGAVLTSCLDSLMPSIIILSGIALMISSLFKQD